MKLTSAINNFYYHMALYELQIMRDGDYYKGLSYNSLLYINVIAQMQDCTASKIAQSLKITKSAVTLKLNELVKQGAVIKEQSQEDRRVFYVRLSPEVARVIGFYDCVFDKIEADLRLHYSEQQLDVFGEILHTISGYEWRKIQNE